MLSGQDGNEPSPLTPMTPLEKSEPRRHYFVGVRRFNHNPEKGMKYLIDNSVLAENEEEIATFLYDCEILNKVSIGDFISLGNDLSSRVIEVYVQKIDFTGLSFDAALRYSLSSSLSLSSFPGTCKPQAVLFPLQKIPLGLQL